MYAAVSSRGLGGGRRCVAFLRRADAERAHGCGSEQDGDAAGAAVDAGFDVPLGVGDEGQLLPASADDRVCDRCPPVIRNALMNPQI